VHVEAVGQAGVDGVEKSQELLMPVPPITVTDGNSAGDVERRT
jgi:hypothetical protein